MDDSREIGTTASPTTASAVRGGEVSAAPEKSKQNVLKSPWLWTMLATLAAIVAAASAVYSNLSASRDQVRNIEFRLHDALSKLSALERLDSESSTLGCSGPGCQPCGVEGCLGYLALRKSYRDQYQLLTEEVVQLAARIPDNVTAVQLLEIANALYRSGQVQDSEDYVKRALDRSDAFSLQFRGHLLLAQIAFFERKLEDGNSCIQDTINLVERSNQHTSIEQSIYKIEARLVCASMHAALGEPREGKGCLEKAYDDVVQLPKTNFVKQLEQAIYDQLTIIIRQEIDPDSVSFAKYEEQLRKLISEEGDSPDVVLD